MNQIPVSDDNLQRIADELEIGALLTRYARGVDTKDWDLFRSVFTEDAVVDYSAVGSIVGTREDGAEFFSRTLADVTMSMHYATNVECTFDGDAASVIAMWLNAVRLPGNSETSFFGGRWYHDMVRTSAGWRSAKLRLEVLW